MTTHGTSVLTSLTDGNRRTPVELPQAHELRRAGVPGDFGATRPLTARDGE